MNEAEWAVVESRRLFDGWKLRCYREACGMTGADLALAVWGDASKKVYVAKLESGERGAGDEMRARLAAAVGQEPDALLSSVHELLESRATEAEWVAAGRPDLATWLARRA